MKTILFSILLSISALTVHAQDKAGIIVSNPIKEKTITISPNPAIADAKITISGNQFEVKSVSVFSIIGSEVYTQNFTSGATKTVNLDVRNLKKGKYMVRVVFLDGSTEVATLIKQ